MFYSNRRPEGPAFLEELQAVEPETPNFQVVATTILMRQSQRHRFAGAGLSTGSKLFGFPIFRALRQAPAMTNSLRRTIAAWYSPRRGVSGAASRTAVEQAGRAMLPGLRSHRPPR